MANDRSKTRAQLIAELAEMRRQRSLEEACERCREQVLLMRSGDDLLKVNAALYREMIKLGVESKACGIYFIDEESGRFTGYTAFENPRLHGISWTSADLRELDSGIVVGTWKQTVSAPELVEAWRQRQTWSQQRSLESAEETGQLVKEEYGLSRVLPYHAPELGMFDTCVPFEHGIIWMLSQEVSEACVSIARGFAEPLSLAYTRHLDLQAAEKRNRQLVIERAAESIRAEAIAMRETGDIAHLLAALCRSFEATDLAFDACIIQLVDEELDVLRLYNAMKFDYDFLIRTGFPTEKILRKDLIDGMHLGVTDVPLPFAREHGFAMPGFEPSIKVQPDIFRDHVKTMWSWPGAPEGFSGSHGLNVPFDYGGIYVCGLRGTVYADSDLQLVERFAEALSLGYARYFDIRTAGEAQRRLIDELEKELQTAHDLQMSLMPTGPPRIQGVDIAGRCLPANHVGGDFYQYFPISDNRLAISLADVTGHAMEAAVPVMMFSGILDTRMESGDPLEELFGKLNRSLRRNLADRRTYVCFMMGELDTASKILRLANGGCPYPYHYRANTGEIAELQVEAYPLGVHAETSYPVIETRLEPGDRVVFCSDGIIEAENADGELFGFGRTADTIRNGCFRSLAAARLLDHLISEVEAFTGETPQGDDRTVVVLAVEA